MSKFDELQAKRKRIEDEKEKQHTAETNAFLDEVEADVQKVSHRHNEVAISLSEYLNFQANLELENGKTSVSCTYPLYEIKRVEVVDNLISPMLTTIKFLSGKIDINGWFTQGEYKEINHKKYVDDIDAFGALCILIENKLRPHIQQVFMKDFNGKAQVKFHKETQTADWSRKAFGKTVGKEKIVPMSMKFVIDMRLDW
jgi:hypothetical protein